MNPTVQKTLDVVTSVPKKIIYGVILAITIVIIFLKFSAKVTTNNAKELNLGSLIQDAVDKFQIKTNKDKIKDLENPVDPNSLEKDPNKILDFYKNRK